jgi:hypothetical protein
VRYFRPQQAQKTELRTTSEPGLSTYLLSQKSGQVIEVTCHLFSCLSGGVQSRLSPLLLDYFQPQWASCRVYFRVVVFICSRCERSGADGIFGAQADA